MVSRFKSNAPINNFILLLYALVVKWPLFYSPLLPSENDNEAYLYRYLLKVLLISGKSYPFIFGIIAFILYYIQAILLNRIFINQKLFQKPNHVAGMSYILITSLVFDFNSFSAPLIGCTFLMWILFRLAMLNPTQESKKSIFDSGMICGLAIMFYSPSIFFLLFVFYGLSIMRPFRLAEWILIVLGIITPFYFLWAILFISGAQQTNLFAPITFGIPHLTFDKFEITAVVMVFITALTGFLFVQNNIRRLLVQSRKTWSLIYFFLFISLIVLFQKTSHGEAVLMLIAVPFSSIASAAFFYPDKKWFPALMHWGMFALSVIIGYSIFTH